MKNNGKKFMALLTVGALSFGMMARTAVVAASNVSGYENLKSAIIKMAEMDNFTMEMESKVVLDGETILASQNAECGFDGGNSYSVGEMNISGESTKVESYTDGNASYTYNSSKDVFEKYVMPYDPQDYSRATNMTDTEKKIASAALDLLVGDSKNYFTQDSNNISFNLNQNQVPEIVQLMLTLAYEERDTIKDHGGREVTHVRISNSVGVGVFEADSEIGEVEDLDKHMDSVMNIFKENLGKFNEPYISAVNSNIVLSDDGNVEKCSASVKLMGKDESGVNHTLEFFVDALISDVGTTVVDPFDSNGKEVVERELGNFIRIEE